MLSDADVFGAVVSADMVEQAVLDVLQEWFPDYLRKMERAANLPMMTLDNPTNYTNRNTLDSRSGEVGPKVVCVSPGLIGPPTKAGDGNYSATWRIGVGLAVAESTEDLANQYVKMYAAMARLILLQHGSLNGLARGITWIDEVYPDLPLPNQLKQYRVAELFFAIDVQNVANWKLGPPSHGITEYGIAETVDFDLIKVPIEGEVNP